MGGGGGGIVSAFQTPAVIIFEIGTPLLLFVSLPKLRLAQCLVSVQCDWREIPEQAYFQGVGH